MVNPRVTLLATEVNERKHVNEYLRNKLTVRHLVAALTGLMTLQTFLVWRQVRVVKRIANGQ